MPRYCDKNNCNTKAIYGYKMSFPNKCKIHKETSMVYGPRMYCVHGTRKGRCDECPHPDARKCKYEGCNLLPRYGYKGVKTSLCKKHKKDNMIVISARYCVHEKIKSTCNDCHNDKILLCSYEKCNSPVKYGFRRKNAIMCEKHKSKDMVTQSSTYCEHLSRKSRCDKCHGSRSAVCLYDNCSNLSKYGFRRQKTTMCAQHKEVEMVRESSSYCEHLKIIFQCFICEEGGKSLCIHDKLKYQCFKCSPESANFCERRYGTEDLPQELLTVENSIRCIKSRNKNYDNYCSSCFVYLFPDDSRSKIANLPKKELIVKEFLDKQFTNMFVHDSKLIGSFECNRRVDFQAEIKDYILCIEIDERQHKHYNPEDEIKRISELRESSQKKLIFIRFNPDNYRKNGKLIKTEMSERLKELQKKIDEIIDNDYDKYVSFKLFFDEDSEK